MFNNPGHAFGRVETFHLVKEFSGGVILSGDDLSQGNGFSKESLTKLKYINNGSEALCNGVKFRIDNNSSSNAYIVKLEKTFFPRLSDQYLSFDYGNYIDLSEVISNEDKKVEVLAYGKAGVNCAEKRPVIVRYEKD